MIDLKDLRARPDFYKTGALNKNNDPTLVDKLLAVDEQLRQAISQREALVAEKNAIGKQIGQLAGQLKKAAADEKAALQQQMQSLQQRPNAIKAEEQTLADRVAELEPQRDALWLEIPQPADADVPVGKSADDNVVTRTWEPEGWDPRKSFAENKGFEPKSHIELMTRLGMVDLERGVKISGSRSYVLTGDGFRLHNAILRYAFDYMTNENGFTPVSVADLVRHEMMVGTGFFPHGRDQVYDIANPTGDYGLALTGTGEVGLMGYHADEILSHDDLPRCYTTVSTCFRREAGAAGKDTAGLYRIHQFDKVEQVVLCEADEAVSRQWHAKMIGFVETLLQRLRHLLPLLSAPSGHKNR